MDAVDRMRNLRPLFLLPDLRGGGAEIVTLNVVSGIVSAGGKASIYLLGHPVVEHKVPDNLAVAGRVVGPRHDVATEHHKGRLTLLFEQVRSCDVLVGALEIKTHLAATVLGMILRRPVVLWLHKDLSIFLTKKSPLVRHIYTALCRFNLHFATQVVTVSAGAADSLVSLFPSVAGKTTCIHNPANFTAIDGLQDTDESWARAPFVLAVGRFIWEKGFDILLDAFHRLAERRLDLSLVILGDGPLRPELERKVAELGLDGRVVMPGFVSPYAAMRRAQVFVMSSRSEGLPMVLIEALYCGAKVVSTDCPSGPREILSAGRYGALAPVNAPEHLAEILFNVLGALDNDEARDARRRRAMDFSFDSIIPAWGVLFSRIVSGVSKPVNQP